MNRGIALITVFIISFMLFTLVGAFLYLTTNARLINERYHENLIALGLAEAGVDYAIWEINYDGADFASADGWTGTNPKNLTISNFKDNGNIYGNIKISVYDPGTDAVTVMSTGEFISITGPLVSRTTRVILHKHELFNYTILTSERITMSGNAKTDSYDSTKGVYGGSNKNENGDIVTNDNGAPAISLTGNAKIKGDANTGSDGTISKSGNAEVTGTESHTADEFIPPVVVPDEFGNTTSSGPLSLSGNNSAVMPDNYDNYYYTNDTYYYIFDSVNLSGNSNLTVDGNVNLHITGGITTSGNSRIIIEEDSASEVYFGGNVSISGNGVWNKTSDPSKLTFLGRDTSSQVSLTGNSDLYGTIYAPSADISISGNGDVYGSIVGKKATLSGNAEIHFDENLKESGPTIGYDPYVWQEK